jgi:hypothetical protein
MLTELIICSLVTWQIVEIYRHSTATLIASLRARMDHASGLFGSLHRCTWCLSVWVAAGTVVIYRACLPELGYFGPGWLSHIVSAIGMGLAVSRVSNVCNDLMYDYNRTPKFTIPEFTAGPPVEERPTTVSSTSSEQQETIELFQAIQAACRAARTKQPEVFRGILAVLDVRDAPAEVQTFWMTDVSTGSPAIDDTFFMLEKVLDATASVFDSAISINLALRSDTFQAMQQLLHRKERQSQDVPQTENTRPQA